MKKLIIGAVFALMLTSCSTRTRVETIEGNTILKNTQPIEGKVLNRGYEEEFVPVRVAAIEKKVVKIKTSQKAEIIKKEKEKPKQKKEKEKPKPKKVAVKPKPKVNISKTQKVSTPLKTESKPNISKTQKVSTPLKKTKTISFKLSFYTCLPSENGGYSVTAKGESLIGLKNTVASNYYPLGTKIYLEGFGTMRVADRGGSNFNSSTRLDVLIQRKEGESNTAYLQRVNNMGVPTVEGYIVK